MKTKRDAQPIGRSLLDRTGPFAKWLTGAVLASGMIATPALAQSPGSGGTGSAAIEHNGESFKIIPASAVGTVAQSDLSSANDDTTASPLRKRTAGSAANTRSVSDENQRTADNQRNARRSRAVTPIAAAIESGSTGTVQQIGFLSNWMGRGDSCDSYTPMGCQSCGGGGCSSCGGLTPDYAVGMYTGGGCNGSCGGTCNGQCGSMGAGGSCQCSYGPGRICCNTEYGHYNGRICDPSFNPCISCSSPCGSAPCMPYVYGIAEGLYFGRSSDGGIDYDLEPGVRVGFGKIPDCATGCEVMFTGLADFEERDTLLLPQSRVLADVLSGTFQSEFYSIEMNKVRISKDVFKLIAGAKVLEFNESFDGTFIDDGILPGVAGNVRNNANVDIENRLFGLHIGGDMYYPISSKVNLEGRGRAGAYINFAEYRGDIAEDIAGSSNLARSDDEDEELAGFFELGIGARYAASRRLSIYARGEVWYLSGVATVQQETLDAVNQGFQNRVDLDDDIFFYGVSGGAELKF